jgi:hypothetical protein
MVVEILIYLVSAISALFITGFSVHMFIGGLVSVETEYRIIVIACVIVAGITGYMTWDVVQRRSGKK